MIVVLSLWLVQWLVLKAAGKLAIQLMNDTQPSWFEELLIGYCLLTSLSILLSLFMPINGWVGSCLLIVAIVYLGFNKSLFPNFKFNKVNLVYYLLALFILILSIPTPNHGDSSFYHAQALQWVESYRAVPGLGNLFGRLAFNSSLFNAQSLFSLHPFSKVSSHFLNAFMLLTWYIYLVQCISKKENKNEFRLMSLLYAFSTVFIARGWISSVAPDVMAGLMMLVICHRFTSHLLSAEPLKLPFLLILVFTAITIKLPVVFILPLLLFYPALFQRANCKYVPIPILVLLPWCIRSIILSGYLIYPYLPMPIWAPDWQVSTHATFIERAWISSWARLPEQPYQYVLNLSFTEWFPLWFSNQYTVNKILLIGVLFSIVFSACKLMVTLLKRKILTRINWLTICWGLVIIIWLLYAPDFRFGYGLILPYLVFFSHQYLLSNLTIKVHHYKIGLWSFILLMAAMTFYVLRKEHTPILHCIVIPESYPEVKYVRKSVGPIPINVVKDENCWNTPVPCVNSNLFGNEAIEARGNKIEDGFRLKQDLY